MLRDQTVVVPVIRSFAVARAERAVAAFWRSPGWNRRAGRWLELVERVRKLDPDLADQLEDAAVDAIAAACTFARRRCDS